MSRNTFEAASYAGLWYEYARTPNWFEPCAYNVTARYKFEHGKDEIDIENTMENNFGKQVIHAVGTLDANSDVYSVQFDGCCCFRGSYCVLKLNSPEVTSGLYTHALVGDAPRNGRYAWILSREPVMDPKLYDEYVAHAKFLGYTGVFTKTPQFPRSGARVL